MKYFFYSVYLLLSFTHVVAQKPDSIGCPKIIIDGPTGKSVIEGQQAIFSVNSFKKDFLKTHALSYKWITINGFIVEGQDKKTVYIDTKYLQGQQIKVAVFISGLEGGCPDSETMTINVVKPQIRTVEKIIKGPVNHPPHL